MFRSVKYTIEKYLSPKQKKSLKEKFFKMEKSSLYLYLRKFFFKIQRKIIKKFFLYTSVQLENKFKEIGIKDGDTVLMHSSFKIFNGFESGPQQLIDCVLNTIGNSGNLLMMSMAYEGISYEYLRKGDYFDVKNTASCMGIVTEIFRRRKNVLRSLNPIHPILAYGPMAKWIIADHDKTMFSCGKGSPFEKILELNTKVLFFDVSFQKMTFYHYIEDLFKDNLAIHLYYDEPFESTVYDERGKEIRVRTYVFKRDARNNRSFRIRLQRILEKELIRKNILKIDRVGNTKIMLVDLREVIDCVQEMVNSGRLLSKNYPSFVK